MQNITPFLQDNFNILLAALLIFLLGWFIVARLLASFTRKVLENATFDDRIADLLGRTDLDAMNVELAGWVRRIVRISSVLLSAWLLSGIEAIRQAVNDGWMVVRSVFQLGIAVFLLDLALFALATWLLVRIARLISAAFQRSYTLIENWRTTRLKGIRFQRLELLSADNVADGLLVSARYLRVAVLIILFLIYLSIIFSFFPATRGIVTDLLTSVVTSLRNGWLSFVDYLPNLLNVALIILATRYLLKFIHFLARAVEKGQLSLQNFYPEWAEPTYQLVRILLVALALVISFPYLPGSQSPAFQGISIFLGFLFSLGSSSVVANMVSGVVLTYTRAFKIGDRVKIADTVGDVIERNLLVTRVRTIKNVDITIPNGMVLSSHVINYSTSARDKGLILSTTVTIGYDVPWRKMHETLIAAAGQTADILAEPRPFVLQTSLDDFYVSYELNAYTDQPNKMAVIYSELHQNIQDSCNAAEIEILSPHYRALRDGGEITIPNQPD